MNELLPGLDTKPAMLHQAMRYSVETSGKRLRPTLCILSHELFRPVNQSVINTACAIELLHTYTLIHDDLPCMDNDDLRRGKLTLHKVYPESIALLAGDALLTLAFQVLADNGGHFAATLLSLLADLTGSRGVIGGQASDILSEGKNISLEDLEYIHLNKTAKLLEASIKCGAILGGASEEELKKLSYYATKIGLAFQIADDILDIEGDVKKTGKSSEQDKKKDKATYPKFLGLKESKKRLNTHISEAIDSLTCFGTKATSLNFIANFIQTREY